MSGMASFDEVCELLQISMVDKDFETLNGFLISLIGKIPGDHEQFDLISEGWRFQVESVRDKMIHTVKVTRHQQEVEEGQQVPV